MSEPQSHLSTHSGGMMPTDLSGLTWIPDPLGSLIDAADHQPMHDDVRLFWDDPPWQYVSQAVADRWASAVSAHGIAVAAKRVDVEKSTGSSTWLSDPSLPRILPYQNERFGISSADFERVDYVDVRLTRYVAPNGRRAYSPEQLSRWGIETVSPCVPSMTLPPEINSTDQLRRTVDAIRSFTSQSTTESEPTRILASVSVATLSLELPTLVDVGFDGFILRGDSDAFAGLPLASTVRQVRRQLVDSGRESMILWVVPPSVTPDDAAKLITLGADAVACDGWCDPFLWTSIESDRSGTTGSDAYHKKVASELAHKIDRVDGLVHSAMHRKSKHALASTHPMICRVLGIPLVQNGVLTEPTSSPQSTAKPRSAAKPRSPAKE